MVRRIQLVIFAIGVTSAKIEKPEQNFCSSNQYILPHNLAGERQRLALMSELLDPLHRSHIEQLGLQAGWHCLEVGCGHGSMSEWLASRVAPVGQVVASDMDTRYIVSLVVPNLEVRQLNILEDAVDNCAYDLVSARAVLHHIVSGEGGAADASGVCFSPSSPICSPPPPPSPSRYALSGEAGFNGPNPLESTTSLDGRCLRSCLV